MFVLMFNKNDSSAFVAPVLVRLDFIAELHICSQKY